MKKLLLIMCLGSFPFVFGQNNTTWKVANTADFIAKTEIPRSNQPKNAIYFSLDLETFKKQLVGIPVRGSYLTKSAHIITLPNADGKLERFDVIETPIMERELAEKFPEMKSYAAQGVDDPTAVARFSVTQFGLHVMTFSSSKPTVFIDPFTDDRSTYIIYSRDSLEEINSEFKCITDADAENEQRPANSVMNTNDKKLRTYRLALSCNGEYATLFKGTGTIAQQKANVQAQMVITMTRVNGVYEKDLAITMIFVGTNDQIIYLDAATDPWSNEFNTKTAQTIDSVIGVNNYDIGHNFNTTGGGNAGCIGCVCASTSQTNFHKGRGYTGRSNPTGDAFDIDYVAHEMGHQFGGYHTQSNDACRSGNNTEVETGSGSSVMGYAGICAANVQNNSDAYFAYVNIRDISLNVQSGVSSSCAQIVSFPNNPPSVSAGADYTIPKSTPFVLTATGSDPDGNTLTYCWEQRDPEAVLPTVQNNAAPTSIRTAGPMFRTLTGNTSGSRYFPNLATILTGATSNTWEVLPSVARTFNFSVTARDNVAGGGQTASDLMVVSVNGTAGPFLVSTPNTNVSWTAASNQTINWDVAGTTANGVNCAFVDIYMSSDGGITFPLLLASKVPNDGSEIVTIPNSSGSNNRIMVRGNRNIFFDISNTNFTTTSAGTTFSLAFSGTEGDQNKSICQGSDATYTLNYNAIGGFSGITSFSVAGTPAGSTASLSSTSMTQNGALQLTVSDTQNSATGFYSITVTGTSGAISKTVRLYLDLLNGNFSTISAISPANMAFAQPQTVTLNWTSDVSASSYDIEISTDSAFTTIFQSATASTNSYTISGLAANMNYFWRILPKNEACQGTFSSIYRFSTGQTNCGTFASTNVPIAISASGTPTINSTLAIPNVNNVTISDINVNVQITHSWVSDLTLTLISPNNTQVQLLVNKCAGNDNINVTFDDSGNSLTCSNLPAISGSVIPQQLLSTLNGQSSQGVWTLRVFDNANVDGGSLTAWSLTICSQTTEAFPCGTLTTTWNGTEWSNGKPVSNVAAIVNDDFTSTEDLSACSLTVSPNAAMIVQSGHDLTVDGSVDVAEAASLTLQNNANLIQIQGSENTGKITSTRSTSMRRLDYTYWSSPVDNQNLLDFSPMTVSNRFYTLNEQVNAFQTINPAQNSFSAAKGYSIRAPNDFTVTVAPWTGLFYGIPHNGDYSIAVTTFGLGFNLIGNPYPSTIDANAFLLANPGTLYFFTHLSQNTTTGTNYASYNTMGGTASSFGGQAPNGTIQTGQGFIIHKSSAGNAQFNNGMRTGNNQNQFFRNPDIELHRIWLDLHYEDQLANQILIGYTANATNGFDEGIDGRLLAEGSHISSLINNQEYVIQGRPTPFDVTDSVSIGFNALVPGNYTIGIAQLDGLFLNDQTIYLKDNFTATVHNITISDYSFASEIGTFNDRFEIIYQNQTLGIQNPDSTVNLIHYKQNQDLHFVAGNTLIRAMKVYDMRGRLLFEKDAINSERFSLTEQTFQNQILLVKIVTSDNQTVVKKVVN